MKKTIQIILIPLFLFYGLTDCKKKSDDLMLLLGLGVLSMGGPSGQAAVVDPKSGLLTSESSAFGAAEFTIVLEVAPGSNVKFSVTSENPEEGTVDPSNVTFTASNWDKPQTVRVSGVDDNIADGNQDYTITLGAAKSDDAGYSGLKPDFVVVTNQDDDAAGVTVNTLSSPVVTSETGEPEYFTVLLNTEPTADVVIGSITSGDTSEGSVSPGILTFTPLNWLTGQTVTITPRNDTELDGGVQYTIHLADVASSDLAYNGLDPDDFSVLNEDNDTEPGITLSPSPFVLATNESGTTAVFTVVLNSEVLETNVVIGPITVSDTAEVSVSPAYLTFTANNWGTPQGVTLTGIDDDTVYPPDGLVDGPQTIAIDLGAASGPVSYTLPDLSDTSTTPPGPGDGQVVNADDDTPGITVTPTSGLVTSEGGGTATFTVALNNDPQANVTIDSLGILPNVLPEGSLNFSSLTWAAATWSVAKTVIVTGLDEDIDDGDQNYTAVLGVSNSLVGLYDGIDPNDINITNTDDDTANVLLTTIVNTTGEDLSSGKFNVRLDSDPGTNTITVGPIQSEDAGEGEVSGAPLYLTFTNGNWNTDQTVTVTGVNDDMADGLTAYAIDLGSASGDSVYAALNLDTTPGDASFTNTDDDTAGIVVSPTTGLVTSEAGATDTFTVVLSSQPIPTFGTGDVVIELGSSDQTEGTTAPVYDLTFTTNNWATVQTVTIKDFFNDSSIDGDQTFTINLNMKPWPTSDDTTYAAMDPSDITVVNQDDEVLDIVLNQTSLAVAEGPEAGSQTAVFSVVLTVEPTSNVTVPLSIGPSNAYEVTLSQSNVVFSVLDWNTPQSVTVTGIDDHWYDATQTVTIQVDAASGSLYHNYDDPDSIAVTVADIEPYLAQFILASSGISSGNTSFSDFSNSAHLINRGSTNTTHELSNPVLTGGDTSAVYLDGDDELTVADHEDFHFGTEDFTIDFWANINGFPWGGPRILSYESDSSFSNGFVIIIQNDGDMLLNLASAPSKLFSGVVDVSPLPGSQTGWHHIALVRSNCDTSCLVSLYYDGNSMGTISAGEGAGQDISGTPSYNLNIGFRPMSPTNKGYYFGWLDNIRIYKGLARWTAPFPFNPVTYFPYSGNQPGPP